MFGQEGLLLSFPTWQNNLGGMGGLLEREGQIPCARWAVNGFKLLWGPGCLEGKAMMMVMKLRILLKQDTALLSHVRLLVSHRRDTSSFLDNLIV